ncbi:Fc receptor-like protein 2 isoform X2 [Castor canadensis]|uniref:Fc receptor-like protein 2 isoform X2 n=1 Tax=Castor canadensis TaxID=51338 RepID=A0AC58KG26_CASCN
MQRCELSLALRGSSLILLVSTGQKIVVKHHRAVLLPFFSNYTKTYSERLFSFCAHRSQMVAERILLLKHLDQVLMLLWSLLIIFASFSEQTDGLTLLAPSSVFEGDSIFLKCQEEQTSKIKLMTYYKDKRLLFYSRQASSFPIQNVVLSDSGEYYCTATFKNILQRKKTSAIINIKVQASTFQPIEGDPVTLTCETQLPPQRSNVQLQFCFFRDGQALGSGCSSSPELQIPVMWREHSGSYWCKVIAVSNRARKQSLQHQIHVQRIPVSDVSLETQAPGGWVIEGQKLVLLCSVAKGTGNITFSWHRKATENSLGNKKTQGFLSTELEIQAMKESDAGEYYCRADNGHESIQSKVVNIFVKIPVSCPVLTFRIPRAQAVVGDVVELHCEALRGSPPILYQFYHEDVIMGNSSAPSGGGVSFNFSLTAKHSGNYSCEANNGLWVQRSEAVSFSISDSDGHRRDFVTVRILGGLFGILGFFGVAWLFYCWSHKISGASSVTNGPRDYHVISSLFHRGADVPNPQESTHSSPIPAIEELQPVYVNVDPVGVDVIYSQVWTSQHPESSANARRTFSENMDSQVIYSSVKKS